MSGVRGRFEGSKLLRNLRAQESQSLRGQNRQRKELRFCVNAADLFLRILFVRICSPGAKAARVWLALCGVETPASLRPCVSFVSHAARFGAVSGSFGDGSKTSMFRLGEMICKRGLKVLCAVFAMSQATREPEQQILRPAYPTSANAFAGPQCAGSQDDIAFEQWAVVDDRRSSRLFFPQTIKSCPDTSCPPEEFFRAVTLYLKILAFPRLRIETWGAHGRANWRLVLAIRVVLVGASGGRAGLGGCSSGCAGLRIRRWKRRGLRRRRDRAASGRRADACSR